MPSEAQIFHLFPSLPAELRLQIWRQSCHARAVEVRYSQEHDRCLTTARPPVILRVCHESRHEGLRLYVKAFGTRAHAANIYFLPALDILYLPRCGVMGYDDTARDFGRYVPGGTVEHVRRLAIDHVKPEIRRPWETYNKFCLLRTFPSLREAFLVLSSPGDDENGGDDDNNNNNNNNNSNSNSQIEIEFVDPRGDPQEIVRLMDTVKDSFNFELGPFGFGSYQSCSTRASSSTSSSTEIGGAGHGHPWMVALELVPKAKAVRGQLSWHDTPRSLVSV
ncbi:hypothetical protein B0T26DRAFT_659923 [Lasiosphaeria miniovina]|uniref:2EXR domain-containing protein n=1 Tax=Lasiosphaeria miniovina TaxID=1954250 RepID=A0AA40DHM4_9PEZI|nr:uncharacterized protein B0T26DRAFT_659923 [Lasiosphaeria miniovina]KAK0701691.1 hypothetical protein B0T26DRAFT_659923 [Lasiosphaeria miniovina]